MKIAVSFPLQSMPPRKSIPCWLSQLSVTVMSILAPSGFCVEVSLTLPSCESHFIQRTRRLAKLGGKEMMKKGATHMWRRQARPMGAQLFPPAGQGFCCGLYKAAQSRWRSVNVGPPGGEEGAPTGPKGMEGI